MDNIKNFIGNVMTTGQKPSPPHHHQSERNRYDGDSNSTSSGTTFLPNNTGRNRTVSESSNSSDLSTTSVADSVGPQMKRKDSEPYFWIMWHS